MVICHSCVDVYQRVGMFHVWAFRINNWPHLVTSGDAQQAQRSAEECALAYRRCICLGVAKKVLHVIGSTFRWRMG